jgi:hypothetical protein
MDELERALCDPGIAHVPEVALAVRKLMAPVSCRKYNEIKSGDHTHPVRRSLFQKKP